MLLGGKPTYVGPYKTFETRDYDLVLSTQGEPHTLVKHPNPLPPERSIPLIKENKKVVGAYFDSVTGRVVLETVKPLKLGEEKNIFKKTGWFPVVRKPPLSNTVQTVRRLLTSEKRFPIFEEAGKRIWRNVTHDWLRISFLGGCKQVGGTGVLLHSNEASVLLDFGATPGNAKQVFPFVAPELLATPVDALVVSHAHLDHSGGAPHLFARGITPLVYATEPTIALTRLLARDFAKVSGEKSGFSLDVVDKLVERTIPVPYRQAIRVAPDVELTFYNAGHLPGSCMVYILFGDVGVLYTSDFTLTTTRLLEKADPPPNNVDILIIESTYADQVHPNRKKEEKRLIKKVLDTLERGGTVILPSFGVGRSQELLLILEDYGVDAPIHVDGMIREATRIVGSYPEYVSRVPNQDRIDMMYKEKQRNTVLDDPGERIILTTSGMLTGGPILRYLRELGGDPKNSLLITGYQAENTLGRRILDGERVIEVDGVRVELKLEVEWYTLSGHVDRPGLWSFLRRLDGEPRVFVVHGEKNVCEAFARDIANKTGLEACAPNNLDVFRIK
ncbi:MAG: hypothetical protein DRO11_02850 [Methanobacteriota archaeon]|nr:MAG: hypothetical protein DRO11_02850 [Euryarchaeota archaeon]